MILSYEQQALLAQLIIKQDQPEECFSLVSSNAKTNAFGRFFEKNGLIVIRDNQVELTPAFFVQAHKNGVTDEAGELTDDGTEMSKQTIEETYRFFRAMLSAVS
jgi:hypothetical protein